MHAFAEMISKMLGISIDECNLLLGGFLGLAVGLCFRRRKPAGKSPSGFSAGVPEPKFSTSFNQTSSSGSFMDLRGKSIGIDPHVIGNIQDFLRKGHKIEAIKHLREATGMGLAEAKTYVETFEKTSR